VKPRSKFISKNLIFFNSKLNGRNLGFNTPENVPLLIMYLINPGPAKSYTALQTRGVQELEYRSRLRKELAFSNRIRSRTRSGYF